VVHISPLYKDFEQSKSFRESVLHNFTQGKTMKMNLDVAFPVGSFNGEQYRSDAEMRELREKWKDYSYKETAMANPVPAIAVALVVIAKLGITFWFLAGMIP
jgi:hypothetical protein